MKTIEFLVIMFSVLYFIVVYTSDNTRGTYKGTVVGKSIECSHYGQVQLTDGTSLGVEGEDMKEILDKIQVDSTYTFETEGFRSVFTYITIKRVKNE